MNTLIHMIALVMCLWATWWFLDNNMAVIGFGVAGVDLILVLWLMQSIVEDMGDATSEFRAKRRGKHTRQGRGQS